MKILVKFTHVNIDLTCRSKQNCFENVKTFHMFIKHVKCFDIFKTCELYF